jgi:tripartite-type tricarboxylate transporter receptor subunit TctC
MPVAATLGIIARRFAALVLFALLAQSAAAQYPARPVRLLIPNPPGGATDTLARVIAPKLGELLGRPLIVENRAGSNGNIASEAAARAAPDGYTLLLCADAQIVISPHLYRMPVDTLKDLAPVATLVSTSMMLVVQASLQVKTLQEFVEVARRADPPLAYASIGNGSQHQLAMEMLKARAGIDLVHVPYKGGGPATRALLAGEVSAMFGGNSVSGQIKAGKLRALAAAPNHRTAAWPDVPALDEIYPGLVVNTWLALFAPSGVPAPIMEKLRADVSRLLADPVTREQIRRLGGLEPLVTTPEEFAALIRTDYARYGELVRAIGVKAE